MKLRLWRYEMTVTLRKREAERDGWWRPIALFQPVMNVMYEFDETGQWWRPLEMPRD